MYSREITNQEELEDALYFVNEASFFNATNLLKKNKKVTLTPFNVSYDNEKYDLSYSDKKRNWGLPKYVANEKKIVFNPTKDESDLSHSFELDKYKRNLIYDTDGSFLKTVLSFINSISKSTDNVFIVGSMPVDLSIEPIMLKYLQEKSMVLCCESLEETRQYATSDSIYLIIDKPDLIDRLPDGKIFYYCTYNSNLTKKVFDSFDQILILKMTAQESLYYLGRFCSELEYSSEAFLIKNNWLTRCLYNTDATNLYLENFDIERFKNMMNYVLNNCSNIWSQDCCTLAYMYAHHLTDSGALHILSDIAGKGIDCSPDYDCNFVFDVPDSEDWPIMDYIKSRNSKCLKTIRRITGCSNFWNEFAEASFAILTNCPDQVSAITSTLLDLLLELDNMDEQYNCLAEFITILGDSISEDFDKKVQFVQEKILKMILPGLEFYRVKLNQICEWFTYKTGLKYSAIGAAIKHHDYSKDNQFEI